MSNGQTRNQKDVQRESLEGALLDDFRPLVVQNCWRAKEELLHLRLLQLVHHQM